jgi:hypothetical protein
VRVPSFPVVLFPSATHSLVPPLPQLSHSDATAITGQPAPANRVSCGGDHDVLAFYSAVEEKGFAHFQLIIKQLRKGLKRLEQNWPQPTDDMQEGESDEDDYNDDVEEDARQQLFAMFELVRLTFHREFHYVPACFRADKVLEANITPGCKVARTIASCPFKNADFSNDNTQFTAVWARLRATAREVVEGVLQTASRLPKGRVVLTELMTNFQHDCAKEVHIGCEPCLPLSPRPSSHPAATFTIRHARARPA